MLRLCSTKSSWLQGLWKKAASQVSFQMRECAWRYFRSSPLGTTVTPGMALSLAETSGRAACMNRKESSSEKSSQPGLVPDAQVRVAVLQVLVPGPHCQPWMALSYADTSGRAACMSRKEISDAYKTRDRSCA